MQKIAALHLRELFELDAIDLVSARRKGQVIHDTHDISQAGISLESVLRAILQRRLPSGYHVGHGHVVDKTLTSCGQFDAIISDAHANPFLLQTEGGSEYVPVEAVYAVGEIKTKYDRSKKPFDKFSEHLREIQSLERADAEQGFFLVGGKGRGLWMPGFTSDRRPRKNPIFSFMFFAESDDFKPGHVQDLYRSANKKHLPSVVCFLDSGLLLYGQFADNEIIANGFHYMPEDGDLYENETTVSRWVYHCNTSEHKLGTHLGWLYFLLASHLHHSTLKPLDPMEYAHNILGGTDYNQFRVSQEEK